MAMAGGWREREEQREVARDGVDSGAGGARACKAPLGMQQCVTYLGAPGLA